MLIPLILITLSILAAGAMAYGTSPLLAQYPHGLEVIMLTRRLQWPLVTLSIVLCIVLLALVISGKRRAWWLIGLAPVLALFVHRFATSAQNQFSVVENPVVVPAEQAISAGMINDDDWVVGLVFDDQAYAFPYAQLYNTPVVVMAAREKRLLLIWSPLANCATAWLADREVRARDLDIVSMPANATLVYNRRLGQFINGVTGRTSDGASPTGVRAPILTQKTTWSNWKSAHQATKVAPAGARSAGSAPSAPVLPKYPTPTPVADARRLIVFIPGAQPVAIPQDAVKSDPINVSKGDFPVLIFRDPKTGQLRAFDRHLEADLIPRFRANPDRRRKEAVFVDDDTDTGWSASGVAVDGDKSMRGRKLKPVDVQEDLYWGVMKFWYPDLTLVRP